MPNKRLDFYSDCVNWNPDDVHVEGGLVDLIDKRTEITRARFLSNVNRDQLEEIERNLGYDEHMAMREDGYVEYFKSVHHEEVVYGFRQSAIEYVFEEPIRV